MRALSFIIPLLCCSHLVAQQVSPEVVSSAGASFTNGNLLLEWTLGEVMTETYAPGNLVLTQGFHQPEIVPGAPLANCQPTTEIELDSTGTFILNPASINAGSTNAIGDTTGLVFTLDRDDNFFDCGDLSNTAQPLGLIVTDATGQSSTCFTQLTVVDRIAPVLECQDASVPLDPTTGIVTALEVANAVVVGVMDNCGAAEILADTASFHCASIGVRMFTVFAGDGNGNFTSCSATVTITDPGLACDDPPVARCRPAGGFNDPPINVFVNADGVVEFDPMILDDGSSDDNTPPGELIFSLDSTLRLPDCSDVVPSGFNGTGTLVGLVVTDNVGQSDTCTTRVQVRDNIAPVITCQDVELSRDFINANPLSFQDSLLNASLLSFEDNCPPTLSVVQVSIIGEPLLGTPLSCAQVGETFSFGISPGGLSPVQCQFTVTISDPEFNCDDPPSVFCILAQTVDLDEDGNLGIDPTDLAGGSDDNGPVEFFFFGDLPGCEDVGEAGSSVGIRGVDNVGQADTCFVLITVEDNLAPEFTCHDVAIDLPESGSLIFAATISPEIIFLEAYSDNCGTTPENIISQLFTFDCDIRDLQTVGYALSDAGGNGASCTVRYQVNDPLGICREDPIANCKPFSFPFDTSGAAPTTAVLNADVFDDGSTDDREVYTLVYSDETDRQENTSFDCSTTGFDQGQSFTAGQDGVIQSIKVRSGTALSTNLVIFAGELDNGMVPATAYVQPVELFFGQHSGLANLTQMLLDVPFPVEEGQVYTFLLEGETTLSRSCAGSPAYGGGGWIGSTDSYDPATVDDFTFEVNIIGPTEREFPVRGGTLVTVYAVDDEGNVSEACETIVNPNETLPVEWLFFSADAGAKEVFLNWETSLEPENAGFHVERSAAGRNWAVIGQVAPNAETDQRYAYTDEAPGTGENLYRIRQTDFDGQVTYSHVERVTFTGEGLVRIYPNPANGLLNVQLPTGASILALSDVNGRRTGLRFSTSANQFTTNVGDLSPGVYFLRVRLATGIITTRRLIVN